eukprot:scaffold118683_cov66-Phaeocystis_antarctica.AAC.2
MQWDGERAGLEGVIPLWRTERTYVFAAPSRGRRSNDSGRLNSGCFFILVSTQSARRGGVT